MEDAAVETSNSHMDYNTTNEIEGDGEGDKNVDAIKGRNTIDTGTDIDGNELNGYQTMSKSRKKGSP